LRAGFDGGRGDVDGFSSINMGFGIDYKTLSFNYAFAPYGNMGTAHRISFGLRFGSIYETVSGD